jgi:hypothetical protein
MAEKLKNPKPMTNVRIEPCNHRDDTDMGRRGFMAVDPNWNVDASLPEVRVAPAIGRLKVTAACGLFIFLSASWGHQISHNYDEPTRPGTQIVKSLRNVRAGCGAECRTGVVGIKPECTTSIHALGDGRWIACAHGDAYQMGPSRLSAWKLVE